MCVVMCILVYILIVGGFRVYINELCMCYVILFSCLYVESHCFSYFAAHSLGSAPDGQFNIFVHLSRSLRFGFGATCSRFDIKLFVFPNTFTWYILMFKGSLVDKVHGGLINRQIHIYYVCQ